MPLPTKEAEAAYERVLAALHDAIVHRPGGPRFATRDGRKVKPLGSRLAGELIGMPDNYVRNLVSPACELHTPNLKQLVAWLAGGMDPAPLDELEALAGRVAWPLPDAGTHQDLHAEAVRVGKEVGDVFAALQRATDPEGAGGARITRGEAEALVREVREACAAMLALAEAVKEKTY